MRVATAGRHTACHLPADRANLALQIAYACFTRITANDLSHRIISEGNLLATQAALLELLGNEEVASDLNFVFLDVARNLDDFETITERRGNRVEHICRGDEHHA